MTALMGATMAYAAEKETADDLEDRNTKYAAETAKIRKEGLVLRYKAVNILNARKRMIREEIPALTKRAEEVEKQAKAIAIKVRAAEGKAKAAEERAKIAEARLADATGLEPAKKEDGKTAKD